MKNKMVYAKWIWNGDGKKRKQKKLMSGKWSPKIKEKIRKKYIYALNENSWMEWMVRKIHKYQ